MNSLTDYTQILEQTNTNTHSLYLESDDGSQVVERTITRQVNGKYRMKDLRGNWWGDFESLEAAVESAKGSLEPESVAA